MDAVIYTFTGRKVNPLALTPEAVCLEDLAHHLACQSRFAGGAKEPISIAQHCVYAAALCRDDPPLSYAALLHDAAEAYLGDVTKWLKGTPEMAAYRAAEERAQALINRALDVPELDDAQAGRLEYIDRLLVRYEGAMGFGDFWNALGDDLRAGGVASRYPPLTDGERRLVGELFGGWQFWDWRKAEYLYLQTYSALRRKLRYLCPE